MAHGGPDWGINLPVATVYGVDDMGELAARLGSIVNFDRRGNVMFLDDFESGLNKWIIVLSGGGGDAIVTTNERARSGAVSCKITTGAGAADDERLFHYFAYPVLSKMGSELSLTLEAPDIDYIILNLTIDDGVNIKSGGIKILPAALGSSLLTLQYRDETNAWVTFSTATIFPDDHFFVPAKLVVDMEKNMYERFLLANYAFDLSAYPIHVTAVSPTPGVSVFVVIVGNGAAGNHSLYIDDVIITQNES